MSVEMLHYTTDLELGHEFRDLILLAGVEELLQLGDRLLQVEGHGGDWFVVRDSCEQTVCRTDAVTATTVNSKR